MLNLGQDLKRLYYQANNFIFTSLLIQNRNKNPYRICREFQEIFKKNPFPRKCINRESESSNSKCADPALFTSRARTARVSRMSSLHLTWLGCAIERLMYVYAFLFCRLTTCMCACLSMCVARCRWNVFTCSNALGGDAHDDGSDEETGCHSSGHIDDIHCFL